MIPSYNTHVTRTHVLEVLRLLRTVSQERNRRPKNRNKLERVWTLLTQQANYPPLVPTYCLNHLAVHLFVFPQNRDPRLRTLDSSPTLARIHHVAFIHVESTGPLECGSASAQSAVQVCTTFTSSILFLGLLLPPGRVAFLVLLVLTIPLQPPTGPSTCVASSCYP